MQGDLLTYNDFHKYQKRAVAKAIRIRQGYLFLDTGMGKTVLSLAIHDQLAKRELASRSLVIAPKFVMNNVWRQEAKEWNFSEYFTFSKIHGTTYRGSSEFSRRIAFSDEVDFHLINYEGLKWLTGYVLETGIFPWDTVFYDESTRMKRSSTMRFKAFKQFMGKFKYRYCLTGTPIPNGIEDIFGQAYVTDQGAALGSYITHFRKNYMVPKFTLHGRVTIFGEREGSRREVAKKIAPRTVRLKKTEHLNLPKLKVHNIGLELEGRTKELYDEMEKEFFIEMDGIGIEAFAQAAVDMKLRQMLQGAVYTAEGDVLNLNNDKQQILKKMLPLMDGNTLIAYNFRFERDIIRTAAGGNAPFLDARTKDKEAEKWIIEWNNGQHKYFLVNPASAAFGLNLQAGGNNIVWFGLTWNAEHYSQLIDRLWRQGQRRDVNVYHIYYKNSIDEVISDALKSKNANQAKLMQEIVDYTKRRIA